jgi:hypothetical protein
MPVPVAAAIGFAARFAARKIARQAVRKSAKRIHKHLMRGIPRRYKPLHDPVYRVMAHDMAAMQHAPLASRGLEAAGMVAHMASPFEAAMKYPGPARALAKVALAPIAYVQEQQGKPTVWDELQ